MRCSRFAYTLVTVVIAVGTIGIASGSSRTGVAAEFGANPIFWLTANRFESVKDWRTFKIMEELVNIRAKNSFLLRLPYKIMISQARNYASKLNAAIDGESINLKSIFSLKMLTLLSTRWDVKSSSLFTIEDFHDFVNEEDSYSKFSPQFNGSFGYPIHVKIDWTIPKESEEGRVDSWQSSLATLRSDFKSNQFADEGYAEEQYSVKYGNAMEDMSQPEEQAKPPQSLHGDLNFGFFNLSTYRSNYYYGSNNTVGSTKCENCWENMAFIDSNLPVQIGSEMMFFDNSTTLPCMLGGGFYYSGIQKVLPIGTYYVNLIKLTPAKDPTAAKTTSGALLVRLVNCFKLETNKWTGAIKHMAVQFSILHDVF